MRFCFDLYKVVIGRDNSQMMSHKWNKTFRGVDTVLSYVQENIVALKRRRLR